jgi:hypothetical protein
MPPHRFTAAQTPAEVDRIVAERPDALMRWLADMQLSLEDMDPKPHWGALKSYLTKRNLWGSSLAFIAREELRIVKHFRVTAHKRVAKQIAMRFVKAAMMRSEIVELPPIPEVLDCEWAPPAEQWVLNYPGLCEDWELPSIKDRQAAYELRFPCPSNKARNLLMHCLDKDSREKFFARMDALYKTKKAPKDAASEQTDDPGLADLEAEFAAVAKGE